MHDTVIPAKLADPTSTGSDPRLKKLAQAVLRDAAVAPAAEAARDALFKAGRWLKETKADTPVAKSGWAQVETGSTTMLRYAASDVLDTAALAQRLPRPALHVYERERLAQAMTARVTHRGVRLDPEQIDLLTERHTAGRAEAAARVRAFGVDNPGSDQQVGRAAARLGVALPKTATGRPSVAVGVLEPLKQVDGPLGELVRAVLDYRHHDTALGLFLDPYRLLCERGDGRARPTIYTLGTDTGRMSATRPNLQQLPREGGVRACITADPGQLMIGADFSGVEIRVAAALSQDPTLLQFLIDGRDLHEEIALQVWGPDPELTALKGRPTPLKTHRYTAKRDVFGRIYGGGVSTLAAQTGQSLRVTQTVIDTLDALTPGLAAWSQSIREAVKRGQTQFPSYSGRIIHLPREYPHKAPNYCLAPGTPILRSDLRHVPASEIRVGDRLVAFDEFPGDSGSGKKYHRLRTAVVEKAILMRKPSQTVRTADGKATTGDALLSLGTWTEGTSRIAGYLAGLYDGEGSMQCRGEGGGYTGLKFSQLRGPVMDEFCTGMDKLGLPYAYYVRAPRSTSPTDGFHICGIRHIMRVLGTLQPRRFRSRFENLYEGAAITAGLTESAIVQGTEDAGDMELVSIQTSPRTLIANGYLSHNCIQGTARELLVDALMKWRDTRWGNCTLLPVHDELDVFVPAEDADEATLELVHCMQTDLFGVQIKADPSTPSFAWQDST
jgi:DNA polymerase family A